MTLICPIGYTINITSAWYGRQDTSTCMNFMGNGCAFCSTTCYLDTLDFVSNIFNGQASLTSLVDAKLNDDDPCVFTYQYSVIDYVCVLSKK